MEEEKNDFNEQNEELSFQNTAPESQPTPRPKKHTGLKILSYLFTITVTALLTMTLMFTYLAIPADTAISKLDQLEEIIDQRFIGEVDRTRIEDAAATAMVNALGDRWSYYISAEAYQAYSDSMNNSYVGVGMTVSMREDGQGIDIRQVSTGGPAEAEGVQAGDILISVGDTDVIGMDLNAVRDLVVGEEGTEVTFTVLRNGEKVNFTVTRMHFDTPVATGKLLENNIGLVTIENFNTRCSEETIAAIEDLIAQGAESLIFDVRNNPGGYKHELVKVLDYLLPEGILFQSVDYSGAKETDMSDEKYLDMPMMVLVNGESYSAAEFFAAALKDYGAAEIVGQPTVGKGYFQITTRLSDGSAVGLSMGKYFTPKGVSLAEAGGLAPDHVVEVSEEMFLDIYAGLLEPEMDPQIQKAAELLQNGQ